ncbi:hypothetical protein M011DRAFT_172019 [Sporormia fimetaria CBS 119925]|uniref:Uncharacterized protein n=1 Tax=Sporormia fimetaria CBS 119925 TaxID=1340428 RepID=A0A6A6V2Y1_9PLEO|nr:hypothetical protein M011DRAFT_172019 [Sporormia fimetaria CBS 119925]
MSGGRFSTSYGEIVGMEGRRTEGLCGVVCLLGLFTGWRRVVHARGGWIWRHEGLCNCGVARTGERDGSTDEEVEGSMARTTTLRCMRRMCGWLDLVFSAGLEHAGSSWFLPLQRQRREAEPAQLFTGAPVSKLPAESWSNSCDLVLTVDDCWNGLPAEEKLRRFRRLFLRPGLWTCSTADCYEFHRSVSGSCICKVQQTMMFIVFRRSQNEALGSLHKYVCRVAPKKQGRDIYRSGFCFSSTTHALTWS